jgi:hypothetical protein
MKKNYESESELTSQTITRKYSNRTADLRADVVVPLSQAAICAALLTVLVLAVFRRPDAAIYVGLAALLVVWSVLLFDHRRALWVFENVSGLDVNRDGHTGEPSTVKVEVSQRKGDGQGMDFIDLPVSASELTKVAELILVRGATFSRNSFAGILSQPRYNELAQTMEARHLLIQTSGNKRFLTESGRRLLVKHLYPDGVPTEADSPTSSD